MSPVPIISRQRALSQVGEIRCGGEKKANSPGAKLESFRLTSQHEEIVQTAAGLWGGEVQPWESPVGPAHQLYTTVSALPCMVIVGYSLNRVYELWEGATKCTRRCDGIDEQLSGKPCLCNAEGKDSCDTITRLMVMLPDTGTSLGWRLRSKGEIAADELDGAMMVAEKLANGRAFVPAVLRLTQRRSVSDGQTKRYVVPVLDFNLGDLVTQIALPAAVAGEIAVGYTPVVVGPGVSLEEGLGVVNGAASTTRSGRAAQPVGDVDDFSDAPAPTPEETPPPAPEPPEPKPATKAQQTKLGVLVGRLRDDEKRITTLDLWKAVAGMRDFPVEEMWELLHPYEEDGLLHFGPLLADLRRAEASQLIDRLEKLEPVGVGAAGSEPPA